LGAAVSLIKLHHLIQPAWASFVDQLRPPELHTAGQRTDGIGSDLDWEIRGKKVNGYCNVNGKGACEATPPALLGSVPRVMSIAENFVKASCEGA